MTDEEIIKDYRERERKGDEYSKERRREKQEKVKRIEKVKDILSKNGIKMSASFGSSDSISFQIGKIKISIDSWLYDDCQTEFSFDYDGDKIADCEVDFDFNMEEIKND